MTSYKIGVSFGDNFGAGGGFNDLSSHIYKFDVKKKGDAVQFLQHQLKLQYMAYYIEYTFYKSKKWEFTIPVQAGIGASYYRTINYSTGIESRDKLHLIIVYEPTMSGTYNIFDWLGVSANVGYRLLLKGSREISQNFNSPIYVFGTRVYYGVLWDKAKKAGKSILATNSK